MHTCVYYIIIRTRRYPCTHTPIIRYNGVRVYVFILLRDFEDTRRRCTPERNLFTRRRAQVYIAFTDDNIIYTALDARIRNTCVYKYIFINTPRTGGVPRREVLHRIMILSYSRRADCIRLSPWDERDRPRLLYARRDFFSLSRF